MDAPARGRRIAFFGGSFDPPHNGHLAIAQAAREALTLDAVLFAPVALQPLKPAGSSAPFADRAAMTRLAIAGYAGFELSLLDGPRANEPHGKEAGLEEAGLEEAGLGDAPQGRFTPNYTVDTLLRLRQLHGRETELFLLLGADSLRSMHHWRRAAEIPFLAGLIVAARPHAVSDGASLAALLPAGIDCTPDGLNRFVLSNGQGGCGSLTLLPDLDYDISATELRERLRTQPGAALPLPAGVLKYIREHGLYA